VLLGARGQVLAQSNWSARNEAVEAMKKNSQSQQDEAISEFDDIAKRWNQMSEDRKKEYSVIRHRNSIVLDCASALDHRSRFLDIGCGTGQLVIRVACAGINSLGIDISQEMISQCEKNILATPCAGEFRRGSFLEMSLPNHRYHLISALGFIEYIGTEELDQFFLKAVDLLVPEGILVVGSRNRLFNVFSMNKFTDIEIELENVKNLISQSVIFQGSPDASEVITSLSRLGFIEPQPDQHPHTGINVSTRFQYSPAELVHRMDKVGLTVKKMIPINLHIFPPSVGRDHERLVNKIRSQSLEFADHRLIPQASSFVIVATKCAETA
jgi:2-polyprenyl-3-methyl-5-hydroxy-6-metoxy-1,4-benzoquinol methylase